MTCCETFAKIWMAIACLLFTLSGLTISGFIVYAQIFIQKTMTHYSSSELWIVFGAGLGLALLSIAVWIATCHNENCCSKVILTVCATVALVLILCIAAAAVVFILWTNGKAPAQVTTFLQQEIEESLLPMCCETNGTGIANGPKPRCNPITTVIPTCAPIICDDFNIQQTCFSNSEFTNKVEQWIVSNVKWIGIVTLIVGLLDLGSFIMMCVLICKKNRDENYYTNGDDNVHAYTGQQQKFNEQGTTSYVAVIDQ